MSSAAPAPVVAPQEAPPARGGCLRVALVGCGGVALLCVLAFVGLVLYSRKNPGVFLDFAVSQIEQNYAADVTEEDKRELHAAVAELKEAIRANRVRRDRGAAWSNLTIRRGRLDRVSHEDVRELIRAFREAAVPPPGGGATPAPVPTPS